MTDTSKTQKIAFLTSMEGIESAELTKPWAAAQEAGHEVVLIAPESGQVELFEHLDRSGTQAVDVVLADASAGDYAALVLPGGVANPDALRQEEGAVALVRAMLDAGKPVAAICHAPWVLAEADVVDGRRLTSWPSLRTDLENAGAQWVDEEVVVDGTLITSRNPDDIPAFTRELLAAVSGQAG